MVSSSKNDPIIKIIELFGESDSDSEIKDIIQPNSVEACIWSDSPVHGSPTTSAVESDPINEDENDCRKDTNGDSYEKLYGGSRDK